MALTKCTHCNGESTDPEYCSICGLEINQNSSPLAVGASSVVANQSSTNSQAVAGNTKICPSCKEQQEDPNAQFCYICGYKFDSGTNQQSNAVSTGIDTGQSQAPPTPSATPVANTPSVISSSNYQPPVPASATTQQRIDIVVIVGNNPELKFSLFKDENLIGRRSSSIKQEVTISSNEDNGGVPAISGRHLFILRQSNGKYAVRDLNSSNGTKVNGQKLIPGRDQELHEGDQILIGKLTTIKIEKIYS